jgi:hypothetical protein
VVAKDCRMLKRSGSVLRQATRNFGNFGATPISVPRAVNDPIRSYLPGSEERQKLAATIQELRDNPVDIPIVINGKEVQSHLVISNIQKKL